MLLRKLFTWLAATVVFVGYATVSLAATAPGPSRDASSNGGLGGVAFRETCGARLLIGLRIWQGSALDAIMPVCGEFTDDGRRVNGNTFAGSKFGGGGGSEKLILCPEASVVRGIKITTQSTVGNVHLLCRNLTSGQWTEAGTGWTKESGGAGGFTTSPMQYEGQAFNCGENEVGYGLHGRSGNLVDSVGLICAQHPSVAKTASNAPAPPSPAAAAQLAQCKAYATAAVAANQLAAQNRCGFPGGRHGATYDQHFGWCMTVDAAALASESRLRDADLNACNACRSYARDTLAQFSARAARCASIKPVGVWMPNTEDAHFNFCMVRAPNGSTTVNTVIWEHQKLRQADLNRCAVTINFGNK